MGTDSVHLPGKQGQMEFTDKDVTCGQCGVTFVFSAGEQKFFEDKGFKNVPRRCKQCRAVCHGRKLRGVETSVTCAECGALTTVPFIPRRNTPVLCRACFGNGAKVPNILTALADDGIKPES
jgi:CxxC-x17-CxxC domain-containing protein